MPEPIKINNYTAFWVALGHWRIMYKNKHLTDYIRKGSQYRMTRKFRDDPDLHQLVTALP